MLGGYVFGLAFGSFVGPICAGYIAVNQGSWRWVYWWGLILSAFIGLAMFCTMEETLFLRTVELSETSDRIPTTNIFTKTDLEAKGEDKQAKNLPPVDESVGESFPLTGFKFFGPIWTVFPGTSSNFLRRL
jgi:MFS family permease